MSLHKSDLKTFNLGVEQGESVIVLHQMVLSLILYSFNVKLLLVVAFASLIFFSFNGLFNGSFNCSELQGQLAQISENMYFT